MPRLSKQLRQDAGMTLVEVLVSIMLLGIGSSALLMSMATLIQSGDRHHQLVETDAAMAQLATALVDNSQVAYVNCASPAEYNSATPLPTGWSATDLLVTAVRFWNGTGFVTTPCLDTDEYAGTYARVQELTIRASNPKSGASHSITVVKRGS